MTHETDDTEAFAIALKWARILGLAWHPDSSATDYKDRDGYVLTGAQRDEYDADMNTLFTLSGDPYAVGLRAWRELGLLGPNDEV